MLFQKFLNFSGFYNMQVSYKLVSYKKCVWSLLVCIWGPILTGPCVRKKVTRGAGALVKKCALENLIVQTKKISAFRLLSFSFALLPNLKFPCFLRFYQVLYSNSASFFITIVYLCSYFLSSHYILTIAQFNLQFLQQYLKCDVLSQQNKSGDSVHMPWNANWFVQIIRTKLTFFQVKVPNPCIFNTRKKVLLGIRQHTFFKIFFR